MYVRIQTWFPFTIQVYVNGHDWLARQMHAKGLGFVQNDNAYCPAPSLSKKRGSASGQGQVPSFRKEVDLGGEPCSNPLRVLKALRAPYGSETLTEALRAEKITGTDSARQ